MPVRTRPGDLLGGRYRLVDLLKESGDGHFWRAHDEVLGRHVALHVLAADDQRADGLLAAARRSATVNERRLLRVLDADMREDICYVINEWGTGTSLDVMLANDGPLSPRRAAWIVSEVGAALATAHAVDAAHGRLNPENVLIDLGGNVRVSGFAVDAALHGLPEGRQTTDVIDLAALLYAALTGRWAGISRSQVPTAPHEAGRVLRPRRVRAGIPRPLDQLCDRVINPEVPPSGGSHLRTDYDLRTARGITEAVREFIGDAAEIVAEEQARNNGPLPFMVAPSATWDGTHQGGAAVGPNGVAPSSAFPAVPAGAVPRTPLPAPAPDSEADSDSGDPESAAPVAPVPAASEAARGTAHEMAGEHGSAGQPTEIGVPIFGDDHDDVSWLNPRDDTPPPPPPFEQPPERPLFDPDSAPGSRGLHHQRHSASARSSSSGSDGGSGADGYWPWETSNGTGTGFGGVIVTAEQQAVPGRSWLRLAAAVAAVTLILVAVVFAYNLGRGGDTGAGDDPPDRSPAPSATQPLSIIGATDLDPEGEDGVENPDLVALAHDGDPSTAWRTSSYRQNFGPEGLKSGVGLTFDLGEVQLVAGAGVTFLGEPNAFEVHVSMEPPDSVSDLDPSATAAEAGAEHSLDLEQPVRGRFVTLWLTSLPQVGSDFRAEVAEVEIRG